MNTFSEVQVEEKRRFESLHDTWYPGNPNSKKVKN